MHCSNCTLLKTELAFKVPKQLKNVIDQKFNC